MPWRYGVIYWVGEVPAHHQTYVSLATNLVESVFSFWELKPIPKPLGDWRNPQKVSAGSLEEARLLLGPEFPQAGVVVPGPESGTFWALSPLLLGERQISPLTLVLFEDVKSLQEPSCLFSTFAFFFSGPLPPNYRAILDPYLDALIGESEGPVAVLPLQRERSSPATRYFQNRLAHELAHWVMKIWAEERGLELGKIPPLLKEGLAQYTQLSLIYEPPHLAPVVPPSVHSVAAVWAQRGGGLTDVPLGLLYDVGISLIDFLVRKEYGRFWRVLKKIPEWLADWPMRTAEWEEEWREWLKGEVEPRAKAYLRLLVEDAFFWVDLVKPLFPDLPDLVAKIEKEEDVDRLWEVILGPIPTPDQKALAELHKRECLFRLAIASEKDPLGLREILRDYVERLQKLWEEGDSRGYAETFMEAIRTPIQFFHLLQLQGDQRLTRS